MKDNNNERVKRHRMCEVSWGECTRAEKVNSVEMGVEGVDLIVGRI